jgi:Putative amidoligase enzyme
MLVNDLHEANKGEVAIIFGRFNPPHKGHRAAWEMAAQSPIWYVGTNKSTHGPKDPLPYDVKIKAMEAVWPTVKGHIVADQSWLTLASNVYKKHGDVKLIILTDEEWVTKTVNQYNGVEGPHGVYKFSNIETHPTPRLSSASALRAAVVANDRKAFADAAGVSADLKVAGKPFFDLVAEYLLPYQKASEKPKKKKVTEEENVPFNKNDLRKLEFYVNNFFSKLGLDVTFSHHFFDRINDPRNKTQITFFELAKLFKDEYHKWGNKIANLGASAEAVLKDMSTDINVPFVLVWDRVNRELDLKAKTIMRKKNFHTPDPIFAVESIEDLNIHFHDTLNTEIFDPTGKMYPIVRKKLMNIAEDFKQFLGVEVNGLKDITISGSNAAFSYTPSSDVDLHLVVDLPQADNDHTFRELFDAKKYQYNAQHNYTIRGYDVELYVQNANEEHISQGIYSVLHDDWVQEPQPLSGNYDEEATRDKYDQIKHLILLAVKTQDYELGHRLRQTIKKYRQVGLHTTGEFGPENLAFKALRSNGYIKKLFDMLNDLKDREFSLEAHEQRLTEIDMSPGVLQKYSASSAAQNTIVGFETEMIVPDMMGDFGNGEMEPDYDEYDDYVDTGSIRSLTDDLFSFFRDTTTRREIEAAVEKANEKIFEYMDEEFDQYLANNKDEVIYAYRENTNLDLEEIEKSIRDMDDNWFEVSSALREEFDTNWDDLDGALRDIRLRKYSNWADEFGFEWPYYRNAGSTEIDAKSMEDVARDISDMLKMPVKSAPDYHAFRVREPGIWYLETDSSIDADEGENEGGLELISPPMPLPQALEKLDTVFRWMDLNGARTDSSTGFHINVSIPNMDQVDYLKLILFLGDQHILKEFSRTANSYARSSLERMKDIRAPNLTKTMPGIFDVLRNGLDKAAMKLIESALVPRGDKYVSVNIKDKYIEFRAAGGNYSDKIDKIKNTMLRYVRVINLAADPNEAKHEYAKKLYTLLMGGVDKSAEADTIKWFSMFSTGNMSKAELVNRLKLVKFARMSKKNPSAAPVEEEDHQWLVYDIDGNIVTMVYAPNVTLAMQQAKEWGLRYNKAISKVELHESLTASKRPTSLSGYIAEADRPFVWKKEEPKQELTEMQKACIIGGHEYVGELK